MKKITLSLLTTIFIILILGCCNTQHSFRTPRPQLIDALKHIEDSTLKDMYSFLMCNSVYHYGISKTLYNANNEEASDSLYIGFNNGPEFIAYLQNKQYHYSIGDTIWDCDTLTAEFLFQNIEYAIKAWNKPWTRHYTYNDFKNYILPYRNLDEPLSNWRQTLYEKYIPIIENSDIDTTSSSKVAKFLLTQLKSEVGYSLSMGGFYPNFLDYKESEKIHFMECQALAHYGTQVLRACGVACSTIEIHWRMTEGVHYSIIIYPQTTEESIFRMSIYDDSIRIKHPKDSMASWKTWEKKFEMAKQNNITELISCTHDITIPLPNEIKNTDSIFLCRFYRKEWIPIDSTETINHEVNFKNVTIRNLYSLGLQKNDSITQYGFPFTILGNGQILTYNSSGDTALVEIPYNCSKDERRKMRIIKTFFYNSKEEWEPIWADGILWGYNEEQNHYAIWDEDSIGYIPVFHLASFKIPKWSIIYDEFWKRPIAFPADSTNSSFWGF